MHILGLLKINSILIKTLRDKGHIVDVFRNENKIAIKYPYNGTILYSNEIIDLSKYDAVLLLDISKTARYLYRLLSPHHLIIGNPFSRCKMLDKVTTSILLSNNGIDVVPSLYSSGVQNIENIKTLSNSIVEKHVDGSRGVDMFKYDNFDFSPKEGRIYQKYIDCGCKDERWIVVDGVLTNAEQRIATVPGEFRTAGIYGGIFKSLEITPEMKSLAKKVYDCFPNCVYTGIDIIKSLDGKIYVGEVNSKPHVNTIKITNHNFFEDVTNYIERKYEEYKKGISDR